MEQTKRSALRRAPPPIDVARARPYSTTNIRIPSAEAKVALERPSSQRDSEPHHSRKLTRAISIIAEPGTRSPVVSADGNAGRAPRKSWAYPRRSLNRLRFPESSVYPPSPPPPAAQYYQDAETRLRLKEYLGSPKGFEDVLEHGYPPTFAEGNGRALAKPNLGTHEPRTPSKPQASNNDAPKFLRSDIISWFDNEDEGEDSGVHEAADGVSADDAATIGASSVLSEFNIDDYFDDPAERSSVEINSPVTPRANESVAASHGHRDRAAQRPTTAQGSIDRDKVSSCSRFDRPSDYSTPISSVSRPWSGARDMTLRMTLTRPELRAPEELLYQSHPSMPASAGLALDHPRRPPNESSAGRFQQGISTSSESRRSRSRSIWKKMSLGSARK